MSPPIQNTPVKKRINNDSQNVTPNSRKRKNILADALASYIKDMSISSDQDQTDAIMLPLQKLNLLEKIEFVQKPTKANQYALYVYFDTEIVPNQH